MHTNEIWQLYHPNGEPIKEYGWDAAKDNPEISNADEIVGVAVVFLYRFGEQGLEFLWQRRSELVSRYPGDYDISAGGHINFGETVTKGAIRETYEEIGVKITAEDLEFVTMRPFNKNRFAWVFAVNWTEREEVFSFNDREVSEVKWVEYAKMDEFREKLAKKPLKNDKLTFAALHEWAKMHGYI